jgi:hypothetical protein
VTRQFHAGDRFGFGAHEFQVVPGNYGDHDLVLATRAPVWVRVHMRAVLLEYAFLVENEDWTRPAPQRGGDYFRDACTHATVNFPDACRRYFPPKGNGQ